jgi:hypothetical protein
MTRAALRLAILGIVLSASLCACGGEFLTGSQAKGTLLVSFSDSTTGSKTLYPAGGISLSTWDLILSSGSSSIERNGNSASTTSLASISLEPGTWTVTVNGRNAAGVVIASGSSTATIEAGKSATVSITLTLLSGTGTLSLNASWPSSYNLSSPTVVGTLTPAIGGSATSIPLTVSGSAATYSGSIAAGSYTLSLTLSDSGTATSYRSRIPEAIWIAANCATTGTVDSWVKVSAVTVTKVIDHSFYDPSALSDAEITAAATLKVYFEHASVGQCLADDGTILTTSGLSALKGSNSRYTCKRLTWDHHNGPSAMLASEAALLTSGLGDNFRSNPDAETKVSYFNTSIGTINSYIDVAMFKFCYIDFDNSLTAASLFTTVQTVMDKLESSYPNITFVWWTMPVTSASYGESYSTAKERRSAYNTAVRNYCKTNDKWLFDIADIESHDGDTAITASGYEAQYAGYTDDGGHPNAAGALRLAQAYWTLITEIAMAK